MYVSILFHCFKECFEPRAFGKVDEKKKIWGSSKGFCSTGHNCPPLQISAIGNTGSQWESVCPNGRKMFDCSQFYFAIYNSHMIQIWFNLLVQIWFNLSFTSHEATSNPFLLKRKADVSPHFLRGAKLPTTSGVSLGNMRAFLPVERVTTCHTLNPMSASLVKMPEISWCIWDVFWSLDLFFSQWYLMADVSWRHPPDTPNLEQPFTGNCSQTLQSLLSSSQ